MRYQVMVIMVSMLCLVTVGCRKVGAQSATDASTESDAIDEQKSDGFAEAESKESPAADTSVCSSNDDACECGSTNGVRCVDYSARVGGFGETAVGVTVRAFCNRDGVLLPGRETVTDSNGEYTLTDVPEGRIGIEILADEEHYRSVSWGQRTDENDAQQIAYPHWTVNLAKDPIGPCYSSGDDGGRLPTFGVPGRAYWVDPTGREVPLGCATVETESGRGLLYYWNDAGLPDPRQKPSTNPSNGGFLFCEIGPGPETLILKSPDGTVLRKDCLIVEKGNPFDRYSIYIYLDSSDFPTNPATCP